MNNTFLRLPVPKAITHQVFITVLPPRTRMLQPVSFKFEPHVVISLEKEALYQSLFSTNTIKIEGALTQCLSHITSYCPHCPISPRVLGGPDGKKTNLMSRCAPPVRGQRVRNGGAGRTDCEMQPPTGPERGLPSLAGLYTVSGSCAPGWGGVAESVRQLPLLLVPTRYGDLCFLLGNTHGFPNSV